ncbi:MAG TPA: glycosyltransferase [Candidatus Dojkabacteria bacterium]|nr:glycosyltransferase [Candidatus Dojkabacteria bacterium]
MSKEFKDLKVAIVHDWIYKVRGGEKCVETFCKIFPQADFYAMFGDMNTIAEAPIIADRKVTFSILNKIPFIKKFYRYTYFLWPMVIENFDLRGYDLVISTSACISKGVITDVNTPHVCYMFTPMRYAWDQSRDYFNPKNFSWWKRMVIPFFLHFIRIWDVTSTARIDYLVPISNFVKKRIIKYYRRTPDPIIFPPVYVDRAKYDNPKQDYYFAIAPFEPNKGGRLMVETAMREGFNLKIMGEGSMKKELEKLSKDHKNIEYLGWLSEDQKWDYLSRAKGFLFCGVEDFGIVPLEAIASGTPVVAYKMGGALDYIREGENGTFFTEQSPDGLKEAIDRIEKFYSEGKFNVRSMNEFAKGFSQERFIEEFSAFFKKVLDEFRRN